MRSTANIPFCSRLTDSFPSLDESVRMVNGIVSAVTGAMRLDPLRVQNAITPLYLTESNVPTGG